MDEIDEINAEIKEIHDNDKRLLHNVNVSSLSSGNFLEDQAEFLDSIGFKAKAKLEKLYERKNQLEKAKMLGDDIDVKAKIDVDEFNKKQRINADVTDRPLNSVNDKSDRILRSANKKTCRDRSVKNNKK
jgi:hypothetical protein